MQPVGSTDNLPQIPEPDGSYMLNQKFVIPIYKKSAELKPMKFISLILPRNENKSITRENKTAVIQHFLKYIRWEQYLKSF